ncbi:MAG: winged helix DNA-binding domain-containing protein [Patulibacter minatonensis]
MRSEQILAFRFARTGLSERESTDLASAFDCPASDVAKDAALTAVGARVEGVDRATYENAVDRGALVLGHIVRGAIHVMAPEDHALFGRRLVSSNDDELARQLGPAATELCEDHRIRLCDALDEVAAAIAGVLDHGRRLTKNELHEALRDTVQEDLLPWCEGCQSHHVSPMLWRHGTAVAGARLDAKRRYLIGGASDPPPAHEAVHRYLRWYAPATPGAFSEWAGVAPSHGRRLWEEIADELVEVEDAFGDPAWVLAEDVDEFEDPPSPEGVRLLPAGDPYLWKPNRVLLAPDDEVRKQLFRPVSSPGAVLRDGRLAGTWRARSSKGVVDVTVETFGRVPRQLLEEEAQRLAILRGVGEAHVIVGS